MTIVRQKLHSTENNEYQAKLKKLDIEERKRQEETLLQLIAMEQELARTVEQIRSFGTNNKHDQLMVELLKEQAKRLQELKQQLQVVEHKVVQVEKEIIVLEQQYKQAKTSSEQHLVTAALGIVVSGLLVKAAMGSLEKTIVAEFEAKIECLQALTANKGSEHHYHDAELQQMAQDTRRIAEILTINIHKLALTENERSKLEAEVNRSKRELLLSSKDTEVYNKIELQLVAKRAELKNLKEAEKKLTAEVKQQQTLLEECSREIVGSAFVQRHVPELISPYPSNDDNNKGPGFKI